MACRWIHKVGLAVVSGDRLLVVRKRGTGTFILPGGKPEGSEGDLATLAREVDEELGCDSAWKKDPS
jgi:8-oxo-dGTP diphosphatase